MYAWDEAIEYLYKHISFLVSVMPYIVHVFMLDIVWHLGNTYHTHRQSKNDTGTTHFTRTPSSLLNFAR